MENFVIKLEFKKNKENMEKFIEVFFKIVDDKKNVIVNIVVKNGTDIYSEIIW